MDKRKIMIKYQWLDYIEIHIFSKNYMSVSKGPVGYLDGLFDIMKR